MAIEEVRRRKKRLAGNNTDQEEELWNSKIKGVKAEIETRIASRIRSIFHNTFIKGCDVSGIDMFLKHKGRGRICVVQNYICDATPHFLNHLSMEVDNPNYISSHTINSLKRAVLTMTNLFVVEEPLPIESIKIKTIEITDNTGAYFDLTTFNTEAHYVTQIKNEFFINPDTEDGSSPFIIFDFSSSQTAPAMLSIYLGKNSSVSSWSIRGLYEGKWYSIAAPMTGKFQLSFLKIKIIFEELKGGLSVDAGFTRQVLDFFANHPKSNIVVLTRNRKIPSFVRDLVKVNQSVGIPIFETVFYYPQLHLLRCCSAIVCDVMLSSVASPVSIFDIFLTHSTVGCLSDNWFENLVQPALSQAYRSLLCRLSEREAVAIASFTRQHEHSDKNTWRLILSHELKKPDFIFELVGFSNTNNNQILQNNIKVSLCVNVLMNAVDSISLSRAEQTSLVNIILRWMYCLYDGSPKPKAGNPRLKRIDTILERRSDSQIKTPYEINIIVERWCDLGEQSEAVWKDCCDGLIAKSDVVKESQNVLLVTLTSTISVVLQEKRCHSRLLGFTDLPDSAIKLVSYFFGIPKASSFAIKKIFSGGFTNKSPSAQCGRLALTQVAIHILSFTGNKDVLISHSEFNNLYSNIAVLLADLHQGSLLFPHPTEFDVTAVRLPNPYKIDSLSGNFYRLTATAFDDSDLRIAYGKKRVKS